MYYSIKLLTKAVVKAAKEGKPLNPCGFRQLGLIFQYRETEQQYSGQIPVFGTRIITTDVVSFVAAVNKVLDDGGEVDGERAFNAVGSLQCPVNLGVDLDVSKKEKVALAPSGFIDQAEDESSESSNTTVEGESSLVKGSSEDSIEEPTPNSEAMDAEGLQDSEQPSEEVQVVDEIEALSEDTAGQPLESGQGDSGTEKPDVDWSSVEVMTKKEMDAYADSLGIKLDARKNKKNMLAQFKKEVEGDVSNH